MAVSLSLLAGAGWQFLDDNANPLTGGLLYTYAAGTTTPLATYTSSSGSTPNANPIVLDAAGRVPQEVWLTTTSDYKFILKNSVGVTIWTKDDIPGGTSSDDVTFLQAGTGAVERTAQSKMRDVVSVKDFGAKGDGTTDDTVAIQNALNTGLDVFIPASATQYVVTGLTMSTQGQTLYGSGGNSVLKLKDASNKSVITVSVNYVTVRDIGINGNKANQSTTTDSLASGVWAANGVSNLTVRNCNIDNCKRNAIAGYGNHSFCQYVNNRIAAPDFIGIYPSSGSGFPFANGVIANNTIQSPGQDGIGTVAIKYTSIVGNTIYYPVVAGIALEARCDYTTVTGNTIVGNQGSGTGRGLQINDSQGVSFIGNVVKGCTEGISISGNNTSRDVVVSGNTFEDCGWGGSDATILITTSAAASALNGYDYGLVISNNTIADCRTSGIYMQYLRNVVITGNKIKNFNTSNETVSQRKMCGICLTLYAHDNIVSDNSITDNAGAPANKVGIYELYDSGAAEYAKRNKYVNNQIFGLAQDVLITFDGSQQSDVQRPLRNTSTPTTFSWARGQIQYNSFPASGGSIGWVSTDPRGGSFGTLVGVTANINIGTDTATLNDTSGLFNGMSVAIAGAITSAVIIKVNHTAKTIVLSDNAGATVTGAAVSLYNPTFKTWGVIA